MKILKCDSYGIQKAKDEEYAHWQSRRPIERLEAMLKITFALYEERDYEELRRQLFRSAVCLPCPWSAQKNTKTRQEEQSI